MCESKRERESLFARECMCENVCVKESEKESVYVFVRDRKRVCV